MATDVLATDRAIPADLPAGGRPYAPSWADRFIDWLGALPGPEWAAWAIFAAFGLAGTTLGGWTWPWDPSTFRAFASAIALPIALWLATRMLERVV